LDTQVVSPGESSRVSPIQWFYIISAISIAFIK
jgi:hypothetical protein